MTSLSSQSSLSSPSSKGVTPKSDLGNSTPICLFFFVFFDFVALTVSTQEIPKKESEEEKKGCETNEVEKTEQKKGMNCSSV